MPAFLITSPNTELSVNTTSYNTTLKNGLSNWQAALISGANFGNLLDFNLIASGDSSIIGTNAVDGSYPIVNALQIIKVVDFLQPAVMVTTINGIVQNSGVPYALEYPNLSSGVYMLLHIHGAINTNSPPPQYAGGWYSLIYSTNSTPKRIKVNYPEIGRFTTGQSASIAYSGNKTFFNHSGGNIILQYVNEGGIYTPITVTTDPNTQSTYIAHGLSYPAAINSNTDPIAPVFALIQIDNSGGLNTTASYVKPPIFVPSAREFINIGAGSPYNNTVTLGSQNIGTTTYRYNVTTNGSTPALPTISSGSTTNPISLSSVTVGPVKIRAIAIVDGVASPVSYIEYS